MSGDNIGNPDHYVVTIEIKHVVAKRVPATGLKVVATSERTVDDVARVVFSAPDLDEAVTKAGKHLELMGDG